ncbi:hypothetical protein DL96DRAFT_1602300 [Flagelloscypha sp. PMI_526]|nr:hypothetical protein DL96DRAFT_1602300 [Flagelloscypha sp. PMI_526]
MSHWPSQPSPFIPSDGQSVGYAVRGDDARADDVQADDTRPPTIVRGSRTQLHSPSPSSSTPTKRKRPKYTRSKNGCLTCRVKKIKCDEVHPVCTRCAQSQREVREPSSRCPRSRLA